MKKSSYRKPENIVRVAVVEDHTVVRQCLVQMLKKEQQVVVAFHSENGKEFLSKLPNYSIDIVLLDLDMPVMDGRETLKIIRRDHPQVKVIMLSMYEDPWIVSELIKEGARSFLKKNCTFDEMMDALFDVKFKGTHTTDVLEAAMFSQYDHELVKNENILRYQISTRDQLILKLICDGKTSEDIAQRMNLSKKSIDAIRSDLLKKIGAKNPAELVRKSILQGLYKARTDEEIQEEENSIEQEKKSRRIDRLKNISSDSDI